MTSRQTRVLTGLTLAVFTVIALILTSSCADEVVIPQEVVTRNPAPTTQPVEGVPLFTSCLHASLAGAPLPMVYGDPGWNPRLDHDGDGRAC